jgi:hypothetical protein
VPNSGRVVELEYASISDRKIRGQLRNPSDIEKTVSHFYGPSQYISCPFQNGPAGRGRRKDQAPCTCLIGSFLDLESPTRGRSLAALTCSLSADAPCLFWQEQHVIIMTTKYEAFVISIGLC